MCHSSFVFTSHVFHHPHVAINSSIYRYAQVPMKHVFAQYSNIQMSKTECLLIGRKSLSLLLPSISTCEWISMTPPTPATVTITLTPTGYVISASFSTNLSLCWILIVVHHVTLSPILNSPVSDLSTSLFPEKLKTNLFHSSFTP